ncbi:MULTISPECIES: NO-inducible flavohemoprotein [unclassified Undibacterium]|uniref:NO-inducible flavohemoprotein n=1 Tax=unclassified Undibacterium TaxID=2630295 RepID=UPI002AC8FBD8|nr:MULTISPECIES: NO-inducible flavohemoprotein [unclassified Undibacterium]MEB0139288.1 NO-inducible flavohemoprotein [Undibacterium sp. CCC2.1]MEB0172132.1 NO-inducible flavohemoprotein [Undibacterium sp. CCC1.1]MEB0176007.1 NO-inducible flavohemoprotein [Undibacterium sp. CCC3.4]MEB0215319.1 NO-inducible flavohemoprotein [Undibacterium sp. 5I2]WPX45492.1 NO-inducible flavohemoprotein [Undibacterium sp. CCC3.4]
MTLDNATRSLVKSTVPVLKQHGETLTRHFYTRMFSHNPELKALFNQSSQQSGRQQQALAGAVLAYAEHIDNPAVLQPVLALVANKHVSLGIRAEHYPIVGRHLLASIREVLGAAASDELIAAWAAAYGQLADILIAEEQQLYLSATAKSGGWSNWRSFRVARKFSESEEITSFYLVPADGGTVPTFRPGQYISLRLMVPALGMLQARQYSLSDAPGQDCLRISVKREAGSVVHPAGVISNLLHDSVLEHSLVDLAPPMGEYFLNDTDTTPVVLISAGVGITPMMAMLEHLVRQQSTRPLSFLHACRHGGVHAFKQRLLELPKAHAILRTMIYYENPRAIDQQDSDYQHAGRLDLATLDATYLPAHADYYLCGPRAFMQAQAQQLRALGVLPAKIHQEAFGAGGVSG